MNDLIMLQIFQNSPNLWKISKGRQNSKKQEPTFFDTLVILWYTLYIEYVLQVPPRPVRGGLGGSSSRQQPRVPPQLQHQGAVQQLQQGGHCRYCTVLYCTVLQQGGHCRGHRQVLHGLQDLRLRGLAQGDANAADEK